ncbi:MAG TPA: hypothetical protein VJ255_19905 [Candidatus Acidoferrum sp.]|nr:hypothetical protein [Candidatus Acidoferrum sp.]
MDSQMITVSFVFTRNKGTDSIKTLLNTLLPEEELAGLWKQKLYSKNPHVAMKAFEMAMQYMFGKPVQPVASEELAPPIKIDISAIPKFRVPAS